MAKIRLASQGVNVSGRTGGLRPVQFQGSGALGALRAPYINPGIANIKYTPFQAPEIVVDNTLSELGNLAQNVSKAAFEYDMKVSQAEADSQMNRLETFVTEALHGNTESIGYLGSQTEEAVKGYGGFESMIKTKISDTLMGVEPSVRARMAERAIRLENNTLAQAASHKAGQTLKWQEQVAQEEYMGVKRDMLLKAKSSPQEYLQAMATYEQHIMKAFAANPTLRDIKVQGFRNDIYKDTIDYFVQQGNSLAATEYLRMAIATEADPNVIAKGQHDITALQKLQRDTEFETQKRNLQMYELRQKLVTQSALQDFVKNRDYSVFDNISDIEMRIGAQKIAEDIGKGINDPLDQATMLGQRRYWAQQPDALIKAYKDNQLGRVGSEEVISFYNQLISDENSNLTKFKNQAEDWVETILPVGDTIVGPKVKADALGTKQRLQTYMESAINKALRNNESIPWAIERAKIEIMQSPDFDMQYGGIKLQEGQVGVIQGIGDADLKKQGIKSFQSPDEVHEAAAMAMTAINAKYGLPTNTQINSSDIWSWAINNLDNIDAIESYSNDLTTLMIQQRFLLQQLQNKSTPSTNSQSKGKKSNSEESPTSYLR